MTISEKLTDLESIEQNMIAELQPMRMLIEPNQEGRVIEPPNGS